MSFGVADKNVCATSLGPACDFQKRLRLFQRNRSLRSQHYFTQAVFGQEELHGIRARKQSLQTAIIE